MGYVLRLGVIVDCEDDRELAMARRRPKSFLMSPSPHRGPVRLTDASRVAFQPATRASVTGGFWAERRQVNRDVTVPSSWNRLHEAGNLGNLNVAAGRQSGAYVHTVAFFDSDVYKWLEAVGWTLADPLLGDEAATAWTTTSRRPARRCPKRRPTTVISTPTIRCSFRVGGSRTCSGAMSCTAPAT